MHAEVRGVWRSAMVLAVAAALISAAGAQASVAYDAAHGVWLISSVPLLPNTSVPTVFVNRSTDDGRTWSSPISIPPPVSNSVDLDKNWTVCDNNASSPFRGHCYTELDNFGD